MSVEALARHVAILICDVDGVLTDGAMYYGPDGEAMKRFQTRDAQGLALVRAAGIEVAWVTREQSAITARRAEKLGVDDFHDGVSDKAAVVSQLLHEKRIAAENACFVGDDVADLAAMRSVGLAIAVPEATAAVREVAHHVTEAHGGNGAVREVCELLLRARDADPSSLFTGLSAEADG